MPPQRRRPHACPFTVPKRKKFKKNSGSTTTRKCGSGSGPAAAAAATSNARTVTTRYASPPAGQNHSNKSDSGSDWDGDDSGISDSEYTSERNVAEPPKPQPSITGTDSASAGNAHRAPALVRFTTPAGNTLSESMFEDEMGFYIPELYDELVNAAPKDDDDDDGEAPWGEGDIYEDVEAIMEGQWVWLASVPDRNEAMVGCMRGLWERAEEAVRAHREFLNRGDIEKGESHGVQGEEGLGSFGETWAVTKGYYKAMVDDLKSGKDLWAESREGGGHVHRENLMDACFRLKMVEELLEDEVA